MKICAISDTHNQHKKITIPECDILIHAGDFTLSGTENEAKQFFAWLEEQPAEYKIFIAGNHDECMSKGFKEYSKYKIIYLENELINIEGLFIYGTPEQTKMPHWPFYTSNYTWEHNGLLPDILITHTPPYGYCDITQKLWRGETDPHVGDKKLTKIIETIRPTYTICGHIHEGKGKEIMDDSTILNVAMLDRNYNPYGPVCLFTIP